MKQEKCDLLVLGAGPGGYVCGIRAAQLGVATIVVDAGNPGGTCLNVGCIPSKALIHAADEFRKATEFASENNLGIAASKPRIDLGKTIDWKNGIVKRLTSGVAGLLKKSGARLITGHAMIIDGKTVQVETNDGFLRIITQNLVIATGSKPVELPFLPFGGSVISSTEALNLRKVPSTLSVVGGGYIGLEIGIAMAKLGAVVTVVETAMQILPQYDAELINPVSARLKLLGITLHLGAKVQGRSDDDEALLVETKGEIVSIPSDKILVTVGRKPVLTGFGVTDLSLTMNGPFVSINDHCATSMRGVYAIGDVTGDPMLAHRAMAQGSLVAENVAGNNTAWDKQAIPAICYTDPEIVTVGKLPSEIIGSKTTLFSFTANGRSMTKERSDGFVRIVFDPSNDLILGIQAVGAGVSEMAGQFALAIEMAATLTDIADTIHAHPTLTEAVQEAALKGMGRAVHI